MSRKNSKLQKSAKAIGNHTKATQAANAQADTKKYFRISILAFLIGGSLFIVLMTHWPALSTKALSFDDYQYLIENPIVKAPSWNSAQRFLCEVLEPSTVGGYYQPLAMISLMLDYARGGSADNLHAFHETSLLLHLLNTALVTLLIFSLFGRIWPAVVFGLLFGLHPMTVETIVWVGERKTVLSAFLALCSLNFYVRYTRKGNWKLYCLTVLTYILALMSKPTSTPLPMLMLVLDYWPLRRFGKAAVIEKLPMLAIGGLSGAITIISQSNTAIRLPGEYPLTTIPLMVCYSFMFYISKIFYPVHLSSHYPFPALFSLSEPMILMAVICIIVLIAAAAVSVRRTRVFLAGLVFFFIGILPTMQIIGFSNVIASDKFAYIPAVGLLISGGYLLMRLWDWAAGRKLIWLYRIGMLVVMLFAVEREVAGTRNYLVHWQNTESLCFHMIEMSPKAPELYNHLGFFYYKSGDTNKVELEKAVAMFRKALALKPNYDLAHENLANALLRQYKLDEAAAQFRETIKLRPDLPNPMNNLALLIATVPEIKNRDVNEAIRLATRACELTHYKNPTALGTLAAAYASASKFHEAVDTAKTAINLADAANQPNVKELIQYYLGFYEQDKPYIEPLPNDYNKP